MSFKIPYQITFHSFVGLVSLGKISLMYLDKNKFRGFLYILYRTVLLSQGHFAPREHSTTSRELCVCVCVITEVRDS